MKPHEARERRLAAERERAARGEALEEFLRSGAPQDKVVPELIPTEETRDKMYAAVAAATRRAERQPRGKGRDRKLDAVIPLCARLEAIERVLAMDRLQRASLTPARLSVIARSITPQDVHTRFLSVRADMLDGPTTREGSHAGRTV